MPDDQTNNIDDHGPVMPPPTPGTSHGVPGASPTSVADQGKTQNTQPPDTPETPDPPAPPSFGLQMAQLVVIPAVIVIICIGVAFLFGVLASARDSLDDHLLKLKQSSGVGKLQLGFQDPRYKDRGLAAYNIATMIPSITDPAEKKRLSDELITILNNHVSDNEQVLQFYLLMALGQLGQEPGLDEIINHLDSSGSKAREGAIGGLLSWPDQHHSDRAINKLSGCLRDPSPVVRAEAAAALGRLATPDNDSVIPALREAMQITESTMREAQWNAGVALARLNDPQGSRFVASVLLDRTALGQLPAGESGTAMDTLMTPGMIDRIMITTLASAEPMKNPEIWDKIQQITDNDPSPSVRKAASQLLARRAKSIRDPTDTTQ